MKQNKNNYYPKPNLPEAVLTLKSGSYLELVLLNEVRLDTHFSCLSTVYQWANVVQFHNRIRYEINSNKKNLKDAELLKVLRKVEQDNDYGEYILALFEYVINV